MNIGESAQRSTGAYSLGAPDLSCSNAWDTAKHQSDVSPILVLLKRLVQELEHLKPFSEVGIFQLCLLPWRVVACH